jgi:serine/threonine protein kinase
MQKLAVTLKFCHEIGVAHRNLCTDKILVNEAGHFILIDFAFACSSLTGKKSDAFYGSPAYMAPEHVNKLPHDPKKADIWAFGIIAFKLVTGEHPFQGSRSLNSERPDAGRLESRICDSDFDREKIQGFSRSFLNFLGRTLEKDPEKRSTAKQVGSA